MYKFEQERPNVLTTSGIKKMLAIRDHAFELLDNAGAVRAGNAAFGSPEVQGDSFNTMACLDFLIELKELKVIEGTDNGRWQDRVLVKG